MSRPALPAENPAIVGQLCLPDPDSPLPAVTDRPATTKRGVCPARRGGPIPARMARADPQAWSARLPACLSDRRWMPGYRTGPSREQGRETWQIRSQASISARTGPTCVRMARTGDFPRTGTASGSLPNGSGTGMSAGSSSRPRGARAVPACDGLRGLARQPPPVPGCCQDRPGGCLPDHPGNMPVAREGPAGPRTELRATFSGPGDPVSRKPLPCLGAMHDRKIRELIAGEAVHAGRRGGADRHGSLVGQVVQPADECDP